MGGAHLDAMLSITDHALGTRNLRTPSPKITHAHFQGLQGLLLKSSSERDLNHDNPTGLRAGRGGSQLGRQVVITGLALLLLPTQV